jgi:hypothetical protein
MHCKSTPLRHKDVIDKKLFSYFSVKLLRLAALLASRTHVRRDGEQINTYICVCVCVVTKVEVGAKERE